MRSCLQKTVLYKETSVRSRYILKYGKAAGCYLLRTGTLFITVTVSVTFFRLIPVLKFCTLKLSKIAFAVERYSGEGVNKILMSCSLSSHSWVALPNIYGLYVELVLVANCFRLLLLSSDGACISLMLKSLKSHIILSDLKVAMGPAFRIM